VAQQKVVDLVIQQGALQIVPRPVVAAPMERPDARDWLVRSPGSWQGLVGTGLILAGSGLVLGVLGPVMLTLWIANSLLSAGACLVFLGFVKRVWSRVQPAAAPAPDPVDPRLLAERSRRVRAILARAPAADVYTFERLVQESRWTQAAMLSTLLHMKERGELIEDLNLDTGEWVYSLAADPVASSPGSLMLEERTVPTPERDG
jgi:hypothetical protein